jgi:glycosyltransferase involved in cell wall biosynthesis
VLSEFHATTLGPARVKLGDKLIITRNGIDADLYKKLIGAQRDPKKVIFASSPDRGVLSAIKLFKQADVAGSSLHIFYGFNKLFMKHAAEHEYGHIPDVGRDISYYDYMRAVFTACDNDDRIVMRGRVGWEQLAKEMCTAGVWLYPTRFDEISCMAAMEAQAAGCIPVCTDHAALKETLSWHLVPGAEQLRQAMGPDAALDGQRQVLHEAACHRFDYEMLADEWAQKLQS